MGEIEDLKAQFSALLAEVKKLRAEAAAPSAGSWAAEHTGVGHPDVRLFPDHPGVNPAQLKMDLKEIETMLLKHEAQLNGDKGGVTDDPMSGAGSR